MRIGIDARFYGIIGAGIGRYLAKLIEQLEEIDEQNEYFIFLRQENFDEYKPSKINFKKVLAPYPWYSLKEQIFFPFLLYKYKLDLVHFPHFNVPIFYFGKFVVTIHDLIITRFGTAKATTRNLFTYKIKRFFYHLVISRTVYRAKKILAVSNFTKKEIINFFKIKEEKIVVVYEAASLNSSTSNYQLLNNSQTQDSRFKIQDSYILYVGNAYPHKNLERLLEAFKLIISEGGLTSGINLVLVGKNDFFYNHLKLSVQKMGLESRVIFSGPVQDSVLKDFYKNALAYIAPALMEGFGLPGLEAMACGCPVVASNAGSLPEIYGQAALYFNPEDVNEIAEKIRMVIENKNLRDELVEKGFAQVKKYSWQKCAEETLRVYQECVENKKTSNIFAGFI
jgi:glycosyltransferase involved in cell wall biosynthesis